MGIMCMLIKNTVSPIIALYYFNFKKLIFLYINHFSIAAELSFFLLRFLYYRIVFGKYSEHLYNQTVMYSNVMIVCINTHCSCRFGSSTPRNRHWIKKKNLPCFCWVVLFKLESESCRKWQEFLWNLSSKLYL